MDMQKKFIEAQYDSTKNKALRAHIKFCQDMCKDPSTPDEMKEEMKLEIIKTWGELKKRSMGN